ncbi:SDR family oxidoreductase [Bradyrhizobium manausense]|uniref:SDR family oxidoreductase n=1 Tax=Bradyrhizobium manausense TaxID=989370 RepID=UPI0020134E14|nr:SDR family oxidoreductase [Bradyrhizobium manausense]
MSLKGRVAVVTGGAGHIGSTVADGLAELGASIALIDLNRERSEAVARDISTKWSSEAVGYTTDLETSADILATVEDIRTRFKRVDVVVNCAALVGTTPLSGWVVPFEQQSAETWRRALEVNLTAPFVLLQALSKDLRESGSGSIVNVSSIYGLVAPDWRLYEGTEIASPAAYAASKAGLIQLTRWLSTTLAPHVRANAIAPGGVFRNTSEPFHSRYTARTPMGRMATEEDIKGAVAFLASDLSAYVTGQCLAVDGGWTAW